MIIDAYDSARDFQAVFLLWQAALGASWPLTPTLLENVIGNPVAGQGGVHFVAREADRIVGFVATQLNPNGSRPPGGCLLALLVHPDSQRCGIGKALHERALASLKEQGAVRVMCGGKYPRIWPGVPDNLPGALSFFKAQGWQFNHVDYDLGRQLAKYQTPADLTQRMIAENVQIEPGTPADAADVLAFNDREFSGWADTYHYVAGVGDTQDFLVARDPKKGVVGSLLMFGPSSHPKRVDALWKPLVGENIGGLGEVGVAEAERGRGIGVGLVARGSELLKERGVGHCNIGFTSLVDFYGKLGYKVWHAYQIAWRTVN